jgi:hypothetical protein
MTGSYHHIQFLSIEMGARELFGVGWPLTAILPISASREVRIIGVHHCAWHPSILLGGNLGTQVESSIFFLCEFTRRRRAKWWTTGKASHYGYSYLRGRIEQMGAHLE